MEDLATDRIYRLMIAQRMRHGGAFDEADKLIPHTAEFVHGIFDEELEKLLADKDRKDEGTDETIRKAREIAEAMVMNEEFTPF
jgi:malate synthase